MIIITGTANLRPEWREEGLRLGCEHSARSRAEPGCIAHNCYEDAERRGRLHFFEKWQSPQAVQTHFAVPESRNFVARISEMAEAPPTIEIFSAEPVELPPA